MPKQRSRTSTADNRKKVTAKPHPSPSDLPFASWTIERHTDWPGVYWSSDLPRIFAEALTWLLGELLLWVVHWTWILCFTALAALITFAVLLWVQASQLVYLGAITVVIVISLVARRKIVRLIRAILPSRKRSINPQSASSVPTETVASHPNGNPRIVLVRKPVATAGGNVAFEYGLNSDGGIQYQCRDDAKVCQRVFGGEAIGLHLEGLTSSEIRSIRINRYWNWIAGIRFIPRGARDIEILAIASPDTPRPIFFYKVHIAFRVGGRSLESGGVLRRRFIESKNGVAPDWPWSGFDSQELPPILVGFQKLSFRQVRIPCGNGEIRHIIGSGEITR